MLVFDGSKPSLCKLCGREKGRHKAETLGCPVGRGSFPWFRSDQFYEPIATRKPHQPIGGEENEPEKRTN